MSVVRALAIFVLALPIVPHAIGQDKSDWTRVVEGNCPIIISTGHGGGKTPRDWPVRKNPGVLNAKDSYTWPLSKKLCQRLQAHRGIEPYWILNTVHRKYADVNRAPGEKAYESPEGRRVYEAFHDALDNAVNDAIRKFGFAFVVDIHGQSKLPDDVYLGTGRRKSMDDLIASRGEWVLTGADSLQELLFAKGYSVPPNVRPPGPYAIPGNVSGGYITHHYGRRPKVDAVQIEVHGRLRKDETRQKAIAHDLADAIARFHETHIAAMRTRAD